MFLDKRGALRNRHASGIAGGFGWVGWETECVGPASQFPTSREAYADRYRGPDGIQIEMKRSQEGMEIACNGITWGAVSTAMDRFELLELLGSVTFSRDVKRRITGFDLHSEMPDGSPCQCWRLARDRNGGQRDAAGRRKSPAPSGVRGRWKRLARAQESSRMVMMSLELPVSAPGPLTNSEGFCALPICVDQALYLSTSTMTWASDPSTMK